jgi:hypothetical protein
METKANQLVVQHLVDKGLAELAEQVSKQLGIALPAASSSSSSDSGSDLSTSSCSALESTCAMRERVSECVYVGVLMRDTCG